jgi:hypothetical protein
MLRSIIAALFRAARHTVEDGEELFVDAFRGVVDELIVGFRTPSCSGIKVVG